MAHKNHFTTIHAQLGLVVFVGFILLGIFGGVVLHPGYDLIFSFVILKLKFMETEILCFFPSVRLGSVQI